MGDDKKGNDEKELLFLSEQLFRNFITFYPPSSEVFNDYWEAVVEIVRQGKFFASREVFRQFRADFIKVLNREGRKAVSGREEVKKIHEINSKVEDSLKKEYVEKQFQELEQIYEKELKVLKQNSDRQLKALQQTYNNDLIPVGGVSGAMVTMRTNFLETIAHILAWRMREKGDLTLVVDPQLAGMIGGDEFYDRVISGRDDKKRIATEPFIEIIKRVKRDDKGQWFVVKKK